MLEFCIVWVVLGVVGLRGDEVGGFEGFGFVV